MIDLPLARFDPKSEQWVEFPMPEAEIRSAKD
jgi:hypothetical protein